MAYIKLSAQALNKKLKGKVIKAVELHPFPDGRGGTTTAPRLYFEGGARMGFVVDETDVDVYGIRLLFHEGGEHFQYGNREGK
jgi:hypothetical protein